MPASLRAAVIYSLETSKPCVLILWLFSGSFGNLPLALPAPSFFQEESTIVKNRLFRVTYPHLFSRFHVCTVDRKSAIINCGAEGIRSHKDWCVTEIAAVIAVIVALGALWLASHANKHVDSSFEEYGRHLGKQVREAQNVFSAKADEVQKHLHSIEREIEFLKTNERDISGKLNTLTQRVKVLEHDLKNMTEALPPQLLQRRTAKGGDRSA
ncbi:hypothetical protein L2D14_12615 [Thalassospiraceae bacterium LMO-JJ14]|nr:hypothetical protein L2D14_12615 [Thalassospiraceae bacterium LMO-JJ14]